MKSTFNPQIAKAQGITYIPIGKILTYGFYIIIAIAAIMMIVWLMKQKHKENDPEKEIEKKHSQKQPLKVEGAYQKRWLFSYNEKDAYHKLKPIADELGLILLAKVRLLDLLEPVSGNPKYKTYFYKVQAKHVDFVLCDKKLVARCIVELDDSSHDANDRQQRDSFVDKVLQNTGYKIIHTRDINEETKEKIKSYFPTNE